MSLGGAASLLDIALILRADTPVTTHTDPPAVVIGANGYRVAIIASELDAIAALAHVIEALSSTLTARHTGTATTAPTV